jgi:F-type H+-transporting ATPase subunit gamma
MEAVSAVKMRKSQERAIEGRPYAEAALRILERVAGSETAKQHPLFVADVGTHDCVIIITSDKGLAGSLNTGVIKEATRVLQGFDKQAVELICFGKKSYEHFMRRGYSVVSHYLNVRDDVTVEDMEDVVKHITAAFSNGKYRTVQVVYQNFVSTFEQRAVLRQLLPLEPVLLKQMVEDILPKHGKFSSEEQHIQAVAYTIEPSQDAVFDVVFPMLIKIMLYHALLESKASEHSARMVAMKNATDKAREVGKVLTLAYNKERQASITAEVSEITGGMEAMSKK